MLTWIESQSPDPAKEPFDEMNMMYLTEGEDRQTES
jgi:hypothetical protein